MKKLLIKIYKYIGVETEDWDWAQLLFGQYYLGALLILLFILSIILL